MLDTRCTIPLFTIGIILRYYAIALPFEICLLAIASLSSMLWLCRRPSLRYLLASCLALSCGFSYANWRFSLQPSPIDAWPAGRHTIDGYIVSLPEYKEKTIRFHFAPTGEAPCLLVNASKSGRWQRFLPGQYWQLTVSIRPPADYFNPGGTDFSHWLAAQGVTTQAYLHSAILLHPPQRIALIDQLRAALRNKVEQTLGDTPQAHIISALTIGDQSGITEAQWTRFRQTGIIHLISISGLHVTMLAGLVTVASRSVFRRIPWLLQKCPPQKPALIIGLSAALVYAVLAGFSIPTQRTVFMLFASAGAVLSNKRLSAIQIWLSALLAVVVLDPNAVQSIGFWLSFLCVGALILASLHTLRPATGLKLWLSSQWAATLASFPVLAVLFQAFPLLSPLANAIAIPLVSVVVTPLALLGLVDPSGYLLHIAESALRYQDQLLAYLLRFPHTYTFNAPPLWTLLPTAFSCIMLLLPAGLPLRTWAWVGFLPVLLLSRTTLEQGQWRAVAIDVGQGLSVLVQTQHHTLLFDTGKKSAARPALLAVLRHYGVQQLDTLVLSHDDNDHTGGAEILGQHVRIKKLLSPLPAAHPLQSLAQTTASCLERSHWVWDGVYFTMMATVLQQRAHDDNGKSCVLKVHTPSLSMLVPGDIGFREENALIAAYPDSIDVDIVLAPHHGSRYASSTEFIRATSPTWAIFSAGRRNRYHHPHPDTLARYQAHGSHILRTDELGAILITSTTDNRVVGWVSKRDKSLPPP